MVEEHFTSLVILLADVFEDVGNVEVDVPQLAPVTVEESLELGYLD
jgi:hypothetical protein